jgi:hypothetical protein
MNRAGGLPVDARSADRSTYIRTSRALSKCGWEPTGYGVGLGRGDAPQADGVAFVNFLESWLGRFERACRLWRLILANAAVKGTPRHRAEMTSDVFINHYDLEMHQVFVFPQ